MNSSSKDDMSRKGKSLAPTSSTNEFSKGFENSKVIPSKSEDQVFVIYLPSFHASYVFLYFVRLLISQVPHLYLDMNNFVSIFPPSIIWSISMWKFPTLFLPTRLP